MSYPRPRNEDDYRKHIKLAYDRALVFCVECDTWRQVILHARATIEITGKMMGHPQVTEIEPGAITLGCSGCDVSIEYLVRDFRPTVIQHILGYIPGGNAAPVTMRPRPRMVQKEFNYRSNK